MTKKSGNIVGTFDALPVDAITTGPRLRDVDQDWVDWFAESIRRLGLCQPIIVRPLGESGTFQIVAGEHRLEAVRKLGRETILAEIRDLSDAEALAIEAEENMIRRPFSVLEQAFAIGQLKDSYLSRFPSTKHGGKGGQRATGEKDDNLSFSKTMGAKVGVSPRTIERSARIAAALSAEDVDQLRDHPVAKNQAGLLALAGLSKAIRKKAIAALTREQDPARTVKAAIAIVERRPAPKQKPQADQDFDALIALYGRAHSSVKARFLNDLLEAGDPALCRLIESAAEAPHEDAEAA
jgi:ParB family chromosome partitioning protein